MSDKNESHVRNHVVRNTKTDDYHVQYKPSKPAPKPANNGGNSKKD